MNNLSLSFDRPRAGFGPRFGAILIDTIFLGVVIGLLSALKLSGFEKLISAVYFIGCQWKFGATLGKRIFCLRLVTEDGQPPSFGQVFVRETIGRGISLICLGLGYLWILFSSSNRTWHDVISKTDVVSTSAGLHEHGPSLLRVLVVTFAGLTSLTVFALYVLLFTSYPLRQWAQQMEYRGGKVAGIHGSLATGFSLATVQFKNESGRVDLRDIEFKYDLISCLRSRKLSIQNISASHGHVEIVKLDAFKKTNSINPALEPPRLRKAPDANRMADVPISIDRIDISDLTIVTPFKTVAFKRFYVDQLGLVDKKFNIARVFVKSDAFDINATQLSASGERIQTGKMLTGMVKKTLAPDYVHTDVEFEGFADFAPNQAATGKFYFGLCQRRIQIKKATGTIDIRTYGYAPSTCLGGPEILKNVNLTATAIFPLPLPSVKTGSFALRTTQFQFVRGETYAFARADKTFQISTSVMNLLGLSRNLAPVFQIDSTVHLNVREWLADLYFARRDIELLPDQRELIDRDSGLFQMKTSQNNELARIGSGSQPTNSEGARLPASLAPQSY